MAKLFARVFALIRSKSFILNAITIDVEDYWSVFSCDWLHTDIEPSDTVVKNTKWFLKTFADHNVKATFFILGEVAEKFPSLVKEIAEDGHEIGTHGFSHKQVFKLTEEQFRREVAESKRLLEDITGQVVTGHRAAAFSIVPRTKWALEVLAQEGIKYDSSIYPISGKRYGWPEFSKDICKVNLPSGRTIIEVPMSIVTVLGKTLPAAGGGYIRHFPYTVTRWAIKRIQKKKSAIVYMHPYEIDTEARTFATEHLSSKERSRAIRFHKMQQRNRNTVCEKLIKLLSDFEFATMREVVERTAAMSHCVY